MSHLYTLTKSIGSYWTNIPEFGRDFSCFVYVCGTEKHTIWLSLALDRTFACHFVVPYHLTLHPYIIACGIEYRPVKQVNIPYLITRCYIYYTMYI